MPAFPTIASITTLFVGTMFGLPPQPTQAEGLPVFPPSPLVTTVLPTSTTGVFLVNACPNAWAELNRLNPFAGKFNGAGLQRLLPDGMEFTRDIQPWLGNHLALALLPPDPATGKSSSPVIVISVAHQDQFDAFLNQLKAIRGTPQIERIDADRTLLYWQPAQNAPDPDEQPDGSQPGSNSPNQPKALSTRPDKANQILQDALPIPLSVPNPEQVLRRQGLAIAQFPGYLAISNQLAPLEQLQTPRTGQPTLATNPQFKRTLQQSQFGRSSCQSRQPGPLVMGYGNLKELANGFRAISQQLQGQVPMFPLNPKQLQAIVTTYDTADLSIWTEPTSIRIQTNVYYTKPRLENAVAGTEKSDALLSRLPAITYLSANSRNLKGQWQEVVAATERSVTSQWLLDGLRQGIQTVSGLRLDTDLVPWMDGNYAFFLFPTTGGLLNQLHPRLNMGVGLMVQTSDRPAAEITLKKLDRFIQSQAQQELTRVNRQLAGQPIISWETKDQSKSTSVLTHGWLDQNTLIVTTGLKPLSVLMPKPYLSLDQNPTFKAATADLPQPNQGYFYINMGASLSLLYGLFFPKTSSQNEPFVAELQQMLGRIRSISSTQSKTPDRQQLDTRFVIAPQVATQDPSTQPKR